MIQFYLRSELSNLMETLMLKLSFQRYLEQFCSWNFNNLMSAINYKKSKSETKNPDWIKTTSIKFEITMKFTEIKCKQGAQRNFPLEFEWTVFGLWAEVSQTVCGNCICLSRGTLQEIFCTEKNYQLPMKTFPVLGKYPFVIIEPSLIFEKRLSE